MSTGLITQGTPGQVMGSKAREILTRKGKRDGHPNSRAEERTCLPFAISFFPETYHTG